MGNKSSNLEIAIRTDKNSYFPGEQIRSSVYINSPKSHSCAKIVLQIQGYEQCEFRSMQNQSKVLQGKNVLIQTFYVLKQFDKPNSSLHGQYEYPFSFILPYYLPGSFNQQVKSQFKAKISYVLKALVVPYNNKKEYVQKIQQIIVREPQKSFTQNKYGEVFLYPKCLWMKKGVAKVCCYFQKNNYLPNQQCIMICQVDNFNSKKDIQRVLCQFTKSVTLKGSDGTQRTYTQVINTIEFKGARKHQGYFGQNAERMLLPLKYKRSGAPIHPSTSGKMVRCEYSIIVRPQITGCCTTGTQQFSVNLQILAPEMIQYLQKPQEWNPQVQRTSKILLNFKDQKQMRNSFSYPQI